VPTGRAPHKEIERDPGADVRFEMARRAAADGPSSLSVSKLETEREGPSYMFRTLELLHEESPGAELVLVMGADAAAGLPGWERPERIVELARIAVAERDGVDRAEVERAIGTKVEAVEMPEVAVSSTMVRDRVAAGEDIGELVQEPVAELIRERGLYGG
jgi:nicotinate-nucleotide adenylyltransferase